MRKLKTGGRDKNSMDADACCHHCFHCFKLAEIAITKRMTALPVIFDTFEYLLMHHLQLEKLKMRKI